MKTLAVIPARYGSKRFPGKPLALIYGKPMIQWVYEGVLSCSSLDQVLVATDDQRIISAVESFGGVAVMTSSHHESGTDRVYEAAASVDCDLVLNIQGDEPLVGASLVETLVKSLSSGSALMSTLCCALTKEELESPNVVKVLKNRKQHAIYFSRFAIPFSRQAFIENKVFKHLGYYGFRKEFLQDFCAMEPTGLEQAESLEQLRALDLGVDIAVETVDTISLGVDVPEDIPLVEKQLKNKFRDCV